MKKLCLFFLFLLCLIDWLPAQTVETPALYQQVRLKTTAPDILGQLMALGLPADHVHKGDHGLELIFSETEVAVLDQEGIPYEVIIPDMRAHYLADLASSPLVEMTCGLDNFNGGNMGGYHTYDNAVANLFSMKSQYGSIVELLQLLSLIHI